MLKRLCTLFLLVAGSFSATTPLFADQPTNFRKENSNVILIILDGVRWQEVFTDPPASDLMTAKTFNLFNLKFRFPSILFGDPRVGPTVETATHNTQSLPALQSIMTGKQSPCESNDCGRVKEKTLLEKLAKELPLKTAEDKEYGVATISSWEKTALAVNSEEGGTFVNAGDVPFPELFEEGEVDPYDEISDSNEDLALILENYGLRRDELTKEYAFRFVQRHRPRFLLLHLLNADNAGHLQLFGHYHPEKAEQEYVAALQDYHEWLQELLNLLGSIKEYGQNTTVIVFTDHGRGAEQLWFLHNVPAARKVWIFATGPYVDDDAVIPLDKRLSHLDVYPTIISLFGLTPETCEGCGRVIEAIAGPLEKAADISGF